MSVEACIRIVLRIPDVSNNLTPIFYTEHCPVRWIYNVPTFWPEVEARFETTRRPPVRGERDLKWEHAEGLNKSYV